MAPASADLEERDRAICARVALARREAGLTQVQMAELLEVIPRTQQLYESTRVPWSKLPAIARITGRSLAWLVHGEERDEVSTVRELIAESERAIVDRIGERLDAIEERLGAVHDMVADLVGSVRQLAGGNHR